MLANRRLSPVIAPDNPPKFEDWLAGLLGDTGAANGQVAVVDLSLIPSDVTHIVIAVLARLVFEASQRYVMHDAQGKALPTALIIEEAHTFVHRGGEEDANIVSPSRLCREAFERIAREGRKFGLGLVLSSQRPSELSPTVLAQCNTFLLHRIVNDADQNLVARLVPDNVAGLLRELPSLPSRQAILLGWATPIPVLVDVDELPDEQRPRSADPDFWDVWTLAKERSVDWRTIAKDWSGRTDHDG
jgi:DNA helicase HerA-like ATPase